MRFRTMGVALIALGLAGVPLRSTAALITLPVLAGSALDQGEICLVGPLCPGNPTLTLTTNGAVGGSFVYDDVANTVSFSLTLLSPGIFTGGGPPAAVLPGTVYSAAGIPVVNIPLGGGQYEIVQAAPATATAVALWGAPYSQLPGLPAVSGLTCFVNTGADQCGVSLGPNGNSITDGAIPYQVFQTIDANVPEPATIAFLGLGLLGLLAAGRRAA